MITLNILRERIGEERRYAALFAPDGIAAKMRLAREALDAFIAHFGGDDRPVTVHHVPGRVEALGNHTDYAGGMVLNFASDRGFIVISAGSASRVRLCTTQAGYAALEYDLDEKRGRAVSGGDEHWFLYPRRMIERLAANFGLGAFRGIDAALASDLPPASGMSSSSALMVAAFLALTAHADLNGSTVFAELASRPLELATYLGCCENGEDFAFGGAALKGDAGVGTFGGSQDHTAILTAKKSTLSLNRYCPARHIEDVPLPASLAIVVAFSGFPSPKTRESREAFNLIARRIAEAPRIYNAAKGTSYRYAGEMLELDEREVRKVIEKSGEASALLDRWSHFCLQNNALIPRAAGALRRGDGAAFGEAVNASHESCKSLLRNISPEIDLLVRCARGALGATGFGAGFGGSAYAVARRGDAEGFMSEWRDAYLEQCAPPQEPRFFRCEPSAGAREMFM